jgi:hypothetical protein
VLLLFFIFFSLSLEEPDRDIRRHSSLLRLF